MAAIHGWISEAQTPGKLTQVRLSDNDSTARHGPAWAGEPTRCAILPQVFGPDLSGSATDRTGQTQRLRLTEQTSEPPLDERCERVLRGYGLSGRSERDPLRLFRVLSRATNWPLTAWRPWRGLF